MADFLNRLAARALGAIPLAEPAIPTRFSTGTQPNAFLASEPAFQPTRPDPDASLETSEDHELLPQREGRVAPSQALARPQLPHSLHIPEANPSSETRVARPASPFQDLDEVPHLPRSQRPRASTRQAPPPPPYAESETVQPSPERAEVRKQHLVAAMNPTPEAVERPAAYSAQATSPVPVPFATPQPETRRTPLAEPMRGPVLQHSERPQAFHPVPLTVSVSIGRIEVRAEITSPSTTAPVQGPRPTTLSLDQFLKQAGGSAR